MFSHVQPTRVRNMLGGGCTDGEYAVRFSEEDLRQPIIRDNVQDELLIQTSIDKDRLEDWFDTAMAAGAQLANKDREEREKKRKIGSWDDVVEDADAQMFRSSTTAEPVDPAVGGLEQVDEDVEMQGS